MYKDIRQSSIAEQMNPRLEYRYVKVQIQLSIELNNAWIYINIAENYTTVTRSYFYYAPDRMIGGILFLSCLFVCCQL